MARRKKRTEYPGKSRATSSGIQNLSEPEEPRPWSFDLQNYVVLFLDVLGQKEEIFRYRLVPDDSPDVRRVVLQTAGTVRELRNRALRVLRVDPDTEFMKSLSAEQQAELKKATHSEARVSQTLSDALVISTPVGTDADNFTTVVNGIYLALLTSSWLQLTALASGHAIRGGMDLGWGVLLDDSEVYGAALASAYQLESSRADYPRVVCGSVLRDFLETVVSQKSKSKLAEVAAYWANQSRRFMFRDDDGLVAVDFLGEGFHYVAHRHREIDSIVEPAFEFVWSECDRFTTYGPDKLARRYQRLECYMRSRRDLWWKTPRPSRKK